MCSVFQPTVAMVFETNMPLTAFWFKQSFQTLDRLLQQPLKKGDVEHTLAKGTE